MGNFLSSWREERDRRKAEASIKELKKYEEKIKRKEKKRKQIEKFMIMILAGFCCGVVFVFFLIIGIIRSTVTYIF